MGLDQYLHRSDPALPVLDRYSDQIWKELSAEFGPYDYRAPAYAANSYEAFKRFADAKCNRYEVAYWRKFNALHLWMERALNNGQESNCDELPLDLEQIAGLRATLGNILADHDRAHELLPTGGRFFFGDTTYNEWYFNDVERTIATLDEILLAEQARMAMGEQPHRYTYYSSW
jgi:hypothetical protein